MQEHLVAGDTYHTVKMKNWPRNQRGEGQKNQNGTGCAIFRVVGTEGLVLTWVREPCTLTDRHTGDQDRGWWGSEEPKVNGGTMNFFGPAVIL